MVTRQGDLSLLDDPVAQQLLRSHIPARLAYVWSDGTPRVVPIGFHWNGSEFVLGTPPDAPKMKALQEGSKVALSIDSDSMPYQVLLVRGSVHLDTVNGIAPEYVAMMKRVMSEEQSEAWLANMSQLISQMARVFVRPEWVGILDFQTRFPSAVERAMERAQAQA
jgi:nitroimidazol reductase NimA-like FMN-containing flavoprotein (pyridoxamine 5'-phosphate oxidase superfamily)